MNALKPYSLIARANNTRNLRSRAKHTAGLILVLVGLINWITLPGYSSVRLAAYGDESRDSTSGGLATATSPSASIFTSSESVIDPALVYSTTGIGRDAIAADSFGNAYVANGGTIMKLNSTGTALVYSTFLGDGTASAIAVDPAGNAYVTGSTSSPNFPTTPGVVQTTYGGNGDAFVAKLNTDGTLAYSTYLGGSSSDAGSAIAIDSVGNAYVAGGTKSTDFPTMPSSSQTVIDYDAFVTKLNAAGSALVSSSHTRILSGFDSIGGFAVDTLGNAYITGFGTDFPITPGALQPSNGYLFLRKINEQGIVYSARLGRCDLCGPVLPEESESANGIAVDPDGNVYVTGSSGSASVPNSRPNTETSGIFVAKLDPMGSAYVYFTILAGGVGTAIAVDSAGNAYVTGSTEVTNFPTTPGAFQATFGDGNCDPIFNDCEDAFVTKLNAKGHILFSSYLGGSGADRGDVIAADSAGNAYLAGNTDSSDFPTTSGAFQQPSGGHFIAFLTKVNTLDASSAIPKISSASVAGKSLLVFGEKFDLGAVILLNGAEQKTRNDDASPNTTLIGKKAGKKTKPGDKLQVRNPNGTLSEEFTFTGL